MVLSQWRAFISSPQSKECESEQNISCLHSQNYKVAIYGAVCLFIFSNTNDSSTNTSTPAGSHVKHTYRTDINTHKLAFTILPDALNKSKCATVWVCVCVCLLLLLLCCSCSAAAFAIYLRVLCAENLPAGHQSPFTARTYTLRPAQPNQAGSQPFALASGKRELNLTENWQRGARSPAAFLGLWAACQHFGRKNAIALNNNTK